MAQHSSGEVVTIQRVQPREPGRLTLACDAVRADGSIDPAYSADQDDLSPPLSWTAMPDADTFALVVEDPDAPAEKPFVHWLAWNIPGTCEGLPAGLPKTAGMDEVEGLVQGLNSAGRPGWMGPKPPPGDGPHRYHFQLFALDMRLDLPPHADLETLTHLLKAHTIGSGELVATFEAASDRASQGRSGSYGAEADGGRFSEAETHAGRAGLDRDDVDRHAPHDEDGSVRPRGG